MTTLSPLRGDTFLQILEKYAYSCPYSNGSVGIATSSLSISYNHEVEERLTEILRFVERSDLHTLMGPGLTHKQLREHLRPQAKFSLELQARLGLSPVPAPVLWDDPDDNTVTIGRSVGNEELAMMSLYDLALLIGTDRTSIDNSHRNVNVGNVRVS